MKSTNLLLFVFFYCIACIETTPSNGENNRKVQEINSLTKQNFANKDLENTLLSKSDRESLERSLLNVKKKYNENPNNEQNIISYGEHLADLGKFNDAINVYTEGLLAFPESYKLMRHLGQRYLTTRQFDIAIDFLTQAATAADEAPEIEMEKNNSVYRYKRPVYNVKFNIWYYLGLSYYMKGNYDKAISSFRKCENYTNNNDLIVAITNWLYASYSKIGNLEMASSEINKIDTKMNLVEIESRQYNDLIMLYRGTMTPDVLIKRNGNNADIGYGIGNYYLINGQVENAINIFNRIMTTEQQEQIGFIAIESDLAILLNTQTN